MGDSADTESALQLGWREWIALPELGIPRVKAKLDTGARSSALHVARLETFMRDGREWVRFAADPNPRRPSFVIEAEVPVEDERVVRSSNGTEERRITIRTPVRILDRTWPIDLTLTSRDAMKFRMLIGREALQGRVVVDPAQSYRAGRPGRRGGRRTSNSVKEEE